MTEKNTSRNRVWMVIGTGTDVGKTVTAAALLRAARDLGLSAQAVKPVQTGCGVLPDGSLSAPDVLTYADACPGAPGAALRTFAVPCSPHLAARLAGEALEAREVADTIRQCANSADISIVEGAGGLLVPLNERETFADVLDRVDAEIVLAASNTLGSINHALLTVEAIRRRGLRLAAIVLSATTPAADPLEQQIREDNRLTLEKMVPGVQIFEIPHQPDLASPSKEKRAKAWSAASMPLRGLATRLAGDVPGKTDASETDEIVRFDERHLWHPYAPTTPPPRVWVAERTRGAVITLADGRTLVDGMSSWWSAIHGYNHPALIEAVHEQAARMPHVMFGGLTHAPAAALGRKLLALAPAGLERVFFCDSGSVATEAAMKMAIQYQRASGRRRKCRLAAPLGGYHGDTLGAMGVCDPVTGMHQLFNGVLPRQVFFDRPSCRFGGEFDAASLASLEQAFAEHGEDLAAVIAEPIVQGAGGMWFYHPEYLRRLRRLCDDHDTLLIFDEIATGFGRTGRMFAGEWADVQPDILCVGKALTGGVMTLAAVLAREKVAATISRNGVFMHGPTFMANPLACAAAGASLDILAAFPWQSRIGNMEERLREGLSPCRGMPGVADVRVLGGIGVVEMEREVNVAGLQRFFVEDCGVWIRPFARLIYVMPPYVLDDDELAALTGAMVRAVEEGRWK